MTGLSPVHPVVLGSLGLILILHFSCFRDGQMIFLFPFEISLFSFLIFGQFIFLILLPNKIFFIFIPNSFAVISFIRILILDEYVDIIIFDSREIIEFCSYVKIFLGCDVLGTIFGIFHLFLLFLALKLNIYSFNQIQGNFLGVFSLPVFLKFLDLFLIEDLLPFRCIFSSEELSLLLLSLLCILLFADFVYCR